MVICRGDVVLETRPTRRSRSASASTRRSTRPRCATGGRRRGAGRARGGGLRRVRRPRRAGARVERAGRTGGLELEDRELPGLPHRHQRAGAGGARLHPGAEVRRRRSSSRKARPSSPASGRPTRSRSTTARASPRARVIIATGAEYRKPPLENLSRFEGAGVYYGATSHGGAALPRRGGHRGRRRQLGGAGRGVPGPDGQARLRARARGRARGQHVALPDPPHRGPPAIDAADPAPRSSALEGDGHLERVRFRRTTGPAGGDASTSATSS